MYQARALHSNLKRAESWANSLTTLAESNDPCETATIYSTSDAKTGTSYTYSSAVATRAQANYAHFVQPVRSAASNCNLGIQLDHNNRCQYRKWLGYFYPGEKVDGADDTLSPLMQVMHRNGRIAEWQRDCEMWRTGHRGVITDDDDAAEFYELMVIFAHTMPEEERLGSVAPQPSWWSALIANVW